MTDDWTPMKQLTDQIEVVRDASFTEVSQADKFWLKAMVAKNAELKELTRERLHVEQLTVEELIDYADMRIEAQLAGREPEDLTSEEAVAHNVLVSRMLDHLVAARLREELSLAAATGGIH